MRNISVAEIDIMENQEDYELEQNSIEEEEKVNVRHTITAEETFTLAKDVFDIRCFIKNVYANRAVIARRLNILTLSASAIFTLVYAIILFTKTFTLEGSLEIAAYVLVSIYAVLIISLMILVGCAGRSKTKYMGLTKTIISTVRLIVRLVSVAITVIAIVHTSMGGTTASQVALNMFMVIISVITIILQAIPLIGGGVAKVVRWLLSPVKQKVRFSAIVLEWYERVVSGAQIGGTSRRVSKKYFDDIGSLIDNKLIPEIGKKYITSIKANTLLTVVSHGTLNEKPLLEGILKNVFAYATACGYITIDPCKDLNFEGSIEEEEKPPRKTAKQRLLGFGKKIGKSMLEKYITDATEDGEQPEEKKKKKRTKKEKQAAE